MIPVRHNARETVHNAFVTTRWTMVLEAKDPGGETVSPALAALCRLYWPPLYAFLRRQGHGPHDAQDLVQGFFERFLERDFLQSVDREKGRFRSFMLVALRHFVSKARRDERTQRRGGGVPGLTLDEPGVLERCEATLGLETTPELVFDRAWAETVMSEAARRLRLEFADREKAALYESLCGWLAREPEAGEYARAAPVLGLTEGALAAAVFRLRRRFRELVREEVAHTVQRPEAVEEEMRYLLKVLTAG